MHLSCYFCIFVHFCVVRLLLLFSALLGYSTKTSLMNLTEGSISTEDFTQSWNGRTYTLKIPDRIGPDDMVHQLFILFGRKLTKRIFIHDPNFFIPNTNPIGLPSIKYLQLNPNTSFNHFYRISLTKVEELDIKVS